MPQEQSFNPAPGIGSRLFGARMGAGFIAIGKGELQSDIYFGDHIRLEREQLSVDLQLVERASEVYEVSMEYLTNGNASGPSDVFAQRIEQVHRQWKTMTNDFRYLARDEEKLDKAYGNILGRLREIRKAAGHATPQDAAMKHGWIGRRYWDHETGSKGTFDWLVGYAIAMGARPEYLVSGTGEMQETEHLGWRERDASEAVPRSPQLSQ